MSRRRIRRTTSEWKSILASFERSGLSGSAFCVREQLCYATFCKWRRQLADAVEPVEFVALPAASGTSEAQGWDLELELGADMRLRLRRN